MPVRFSISESGRGEDLEHNLIALEYRLFDLKPMADIAEQVMARQNEEGALMGIDQYGNTYDELAESTWRTRKGSGPPLAPQGASSRIITEFRTHQEPGFDEITVKGGWPGLPWIRFHKTGAPKNNMPERDPIGMRPHGWQQLMVEFHNWVERTLKGDGGSSPPAGAGALEPMAGNGPGLTLY